MISLLKEQIITINRLTILNHGGNFVPPYNLLNESALNYLVDVILSEIYGQALYPYIFEKAGVYMFNIIANHVFMDGNKRTGLEAGLMFLKLNGYQLKEKVSTEILTDFIISIASGEQTLETVQNWLKINSTIK